MSATTTAKPKIVRKAIRKVPGVCVVYNDGSIRIDNVPVSYPLVGRPQKNINEETGVETEAYGLSAMLPKETHREAQKACSESIASLEKQMTAKGKGKGGRPFKYQASKKFIKNGDAVDEDGERLFSNNPEYAGHFIVSARSPDQPQIRGRKKDPDTGKPERLTSAQAIKMIYGGAICTLLIRPWPQDNKYGIRANAELLAVQWKAKGEPFGDQRRIGEDEIDDSLEADDDDLDGGWGDGDDDDLG